MNKRQFVLASLTLPTGVFAQESQAGKISITPVVITSVRAQHSSTEVEGIIRGANTGTRLVLVLRLARTSGFVVGSDERGVPKMPRIEGNLPPPPQLGGDAKWKAVVWLPESEVFLREVHVIACDVRPRIGSTPESDYESFRHLPFQRAENIDDVLKLLRSFDWSPIGYTLKRLGPNF